MKSRNLLFLLIAIVAVISAVFVSCNFNIDQSSRETTVNFVPSTSKSLNQSGSAQSIADQDASMYRWEYAVIKDNVVDTKDETVEWKEFQTPIKDGSGNITSYKVTESGLGAIRGLERNEVYGFALRGYTTGTDGELMWEGATSRTYKLQSKVVQITVDVIPVGRGMLYFDIYAPVSDFNDTADSEHPDKFEVSYKSMTKEDSGSLTCKTVLTSDSDEYFYNTIGKEPVLISSGTYLFTVQQTTYDDDLKKYVEIKGRKQVLIVDIYSGIDTVISGSLDSTSLITFDYEAGASGTQYGIEVEFDKPNTGLVGEFAATVYRENGTKLATASVGSHLAEGNVDEMLSIKWSTSTDMQIFVNGEPISTSGSEFLTAANGFLLREDGEETYLKTSGTNCLLAKVVSGYEYIVTIVYNKDQSSRQSVSFTVSYAPEPVGFSAAGPFTITAYNSSKTWDGALYYNIGNGWVLWDGKGITTVAPNYTVSFRGVGNTVITGHTSKGFVLNSGYNVSIKGNISAFFDYKKSPEQIVMGNNALAGLFSNNLNSHGWNKLVATPVFDIPKLSDGCFEEMFRDCDYLVKTPVLTATDLADSCYKDMFYGCYNIKQITDLPATELKPHCYEHMFAECSTLSDNQGNPIVLPATKLAEYCYARMFEGCSSLTAFPKLNAPVLAKACYNRMFYGCMTLTEALELPATKLADFCYYYMFGHCNNLVTPTDLPATELAIGCYSFMYCNCTNLSSVPKISATTIAELCYSGMFAVCTNLKTVPENYLPSTVAPYGCYQFMFAQSGIEKAPALPATSGNCKEFCYCGMYEGCASLKDITLTGDVYLTFENRMVVGYENKLKFDPTAMPGKRSFTRMFNGCSSLTIYSTDTDIVKEGKTAKKIFENIPSAYYNTWAYGSEWIYNIALYSMFDSSEANRNFDMFLPLEVEFSYDVTRPSVSTKTIMKDGVSTTPQEGSTYYIGI